MAQIDFDATTVEPSTTFDAIPKGEYLAMAVDSELKDTKAGNGQFLQIVWEIVDGEHKGRRLWSRLNIVNANDTAVKIARAELSAICHAVEVMKPKDSTEFHGKLAVINVVLEPRADRPGEFSNSIKGYKSPDAKKNTPPSTATTTSAAAKPPWKK